MASARRQRVLYVNHTAELGGAEFSLLDLLTHLDRNRFEPVAVLPVRGPLLERVRALDVPVHTVPMRRLKRTKDPFVQIPSLVQWLLSRRKVAEIARRERIDLIHANSTTAFLYAAAAAREIKAVWHERDLGKLSRPERYLAARASRIIAISESVAQPLLHEFGASGKVRMIHNGVDVDRFKPMERDEEVRRGLGASSDELLVGMVAHFARWKRHELFLFVAAEVLKRRPSARFVIVGDDPFGEHRRYRHKLYRRTRQLGLVERVKFAGIREDMPAVLNALDVLVHPTESEPFGRVILEAMACGVPVVAVDRAGPSEIIIDGESGTLMPDNEIPTVVEAVLGMLQDVQLRQQIGDGARERAIAAFDVRRTVSEIEKLYEEVLA